MQFWILSPPSSTKELADFYGSEIFDDPIHCGVNPGHRRAGQRRSNLSLFLPARNLKYVIWTWMSECLVGDRVLEVFAQKKFTGFQTRPATARLPHGGQTVRLHELMVTGWGGMASRSSGIRVIEECKSCGHKVYSIYSNPSLIFDQSNGMEVTFLWYGGYQNISLYQTGFVKRL
jgi:hypothetical protein